MLPPSLLPELFAQSTLPRYGHSALPGAPVRPERTRKVVTRLVPRRRNRPVVPVPPTAESRSDRPDAA